MGTTIILYRAMCKEEMDSVNVIGISHKSGCYEGKLFATNLEDATRFGKDNFLFDSKPNFIGKFVVPKSMHHILDGPNELDFKDTYYVNEENHNQFNKYVTFEEILFCPIV